MQKDVIASIKDANNTAFIDFNTPCEENFRTKLILNDNPNKKILSTIIKEPIVPNLFSYHKYYYL